MWSHGTKEQRNEWQRNRRWRQNITCKNIRRKYQWSPAAITTLGRHRKWARWCKSWIHQYKSRKWQILERSKSWKGTQLKKVEITKKCVNKLCEQTLNRPKGTTGLGYTNQGESS